MESVPPPRRHPVLGKVVASTWSVVLLLIGAGIATAVHPPSPAPLTCSQWVAEVDNTLNTDPGAITMLRTHPDGDEQNSCDLQESVIISTWEREHPARVPTSP